jgi:hypothetical protein
VQEFRKVELNPRKALLRGSHDGSMPLRNAGRPKERRKGLVRRRPDALLPPSYAFGCKCRVREVVPSPLWGRTNHSPGPPLKALMRAFPAQSRRAAPWVRRANTSHPVGVHQGDGRTSGTPCQGVILASPPPRAPPFADSGRWPWAMVGTRPVPWSAWPPGSPLLACPELAEGPPPEGQTLAHKLLQDTEARQTERKRRQAAAHQGLPHEREVDGRRRLGEQKRAGVLSGLLHPVSTGMRQFAVRRTA